MAVNATMGSIWRRWDLHLHAPETKMADAYGTGDEVWNEYIDTLEKSEVEVFGITDYFCGNCYFNLIDRYHKRYPKPSKTFFLNIEFRLAESISKDGSHPHIHVIFDNAPNVTSREKIDRFLTDLTTHSPDTAGTTKRCFDLKTTAEIEAATISLDSLSKALTNTFGDDKPYLIVFPANNNGTRSTDSNSPRKVTLADQIDRASDMFFGRADNRDFYLRSDRYEEGESLPKPVVSGSDAHSLAELERLTGDAPNYPATWIKADTTFEGLRQICHEPTGRVHIGTEPEVLKRRREHGTKFISALQIDTIEIYNGSNGQWFKNVNIPFNPELTAIIGNKGSGKSALVDILGLLGESRQEKYFSFLSDDAKNKKFRRAGFAENFTARVEWHSGAPSGKSLIDNHDVTKPETLRYLPQNYFEQITNDLEITVFQREIENVVFSHVDVSDRLGTSSFEELEEKMTRVSKQEIDTLTQKLNRTNEDMVALEEQASQEYRDRLRALITTKEAEIKAIDDIKVEVPTKPDEHSEEHEERRKSIEQWTTLLTSLKQKIGEKEVEKSKLQFNLHSAKELKQELESIEKKTRLALDELTPKLVNAGISESDVWTLEIRLAPIETGIRELESRIAALSKPNEQDFTDDNAGDQLNSIPELRVAVSYAEKKRDNLKSGLDAATRRYQDYQDGLTERKEKRSKLIGEGDAPKPDTLNGLKAKLQYLEKELPDELTEARAERESLTRDIYEAKKTRLKFYQDLKQSVEEPLAAIVSDGFEIQIEAALVFNDDFQRAFLQHIDQRKKGPFRGSDGSKLLDRMARNVDLNDFDAVYSFCTRIVDDMTTNDSSGTKIADQVNKESEFYNYLFSLSYLETHYKLQLSGKDLNELSPGEKGLLLLIFYLQLDRDTTPLVIDQPEDNLDNESVFRVLAHCIREAKKRRQVILVTHNPNLAVGADAEEIVYVSLDKTDNYSFSYETGAIENPSLNKRMVDILEGTQPAFVKRRLKYLFQST